MLWLFNWKGQSGFSGSSTAEEVLRGIDGTGLTAVITGASSGIGFETARVLAKCGVHVVMAVRNMESGKAAQDAILEQNPSGPVEVMELDLSSLISVRNFAENYTNRGLPLNILINNAGIMATPFALSQDNIEMQMATNHIGHFLLTNLLIDTMKETAMVSNREGRIVIVSSEAHRHSYSQGIAFDHVNDPSRYNRFLAYGQSKLANVLHAIELSKRLKDDGALITANSLHPGQIDTNLFHHIPIYNCVAATVCKIFGKTVEQGAATTCYVALHPNVEGVSGQYFKNCNLAKASLSGRRAAISGILWAFSSDKVGYFR